MFSSRQLSHQISFVKMRANVYRLAIGSSTPGCVVLVVDNTTVKFYDTVLELLQIKFLMFVDIGFLQNFNWVFKMLKFWKISPKNLENFCSDL